VSKHPQTCGCGVICGQMSEHTKMCAYLGTMTGRFKVCPCEDKQIPIEVDAGEVMDDLTAEIDRVAKAANEQGQDVAERLVTVYECQVHGKEVDVLTFTSSQIGGARAYCLQCFIQQIEAFIKPLKGKQCIRTTKED